MKPSTEALALAGTSRSPAAAATFVAAAAAGERRSAAATAQPECYGFCMRAPPHVAPGSGVPRYGKAGSSGPAALTFAPGLVDAVVQAEGRACPAAPLAACRRRRACRCRRRRWPRTGRPSPRPARCRRRRRSGAARSESRRGRRRRRRAGRRAGRAGSARLGVAAIAVFRRSISEATPVDGDADARLVHARDAGEEGRHQVGAREVRRRDVRRWRARSRAAPAASGWSRRSANWPSSFGLELLNLSLSCRPITTSLTSGMPRRETCVQAPPAIAGSAWPLFGALLEQRALAQAGRGPAADHRSSPPAASRQLVGTSSASVVTFLHRRGRRCRRPSALSSRNALGGLKSAAPGTLTRSKIDAEVDRERVLALADEDLARRRCSRGC